MGVVIREFEVNTEASDQQADQSSAEPKPSPRLSAQDIASLLSREQQRLARVWAH